jgi:hypothetical protein
MAKAQVYRLKLSPELVARLRERAEREGTNLSGALAIELGTTLTMRNILPSKIGVSTEILCKDNGRDDNGGMPATAPVKRGRGRPRTKVRPVTFWASKQAWDYLREQKKRTGKPFAVVIEDALSKAAK